eukprot:SAG31_NODE_18351_length_639_cov_1.050000_2_plen_60_part_00
MFTAESNVHCKYRVVFGKCIDGDGRVQGDQEVKVQTVEYSRFFSSEDYASSLSTMQCRR